MSIARLACVAAAFALAACSEEPAQPKAPAAVVEKGIFISANDCAASGKLTGDECGEAIDAAVARHEEQSKSYKSLKQCAAAQGEDRCAKTADGSYRTRLQAFFIIMSKPPRAEPLYPPTKKETVGFRSPTQPSIDANDENLIVSSAAKSIAHQNSQLP